MPFNAKRLHRRCLELKDENDALRAECLRLRAIFDMLETKKSTFHNGASYEVILALIQKARDIKRAA